MKIIIASKMNRFSLGYGNKIKLIIEIVLKFSIFQQREKKYDGLLKLFVCCCNFSIPINLKMAVCMKCELGNRLFIV